MNSHNRLAAPSFPGLDLSTPELVQMIEGHAEWVADCLKDPHESWMPHVFVWGKSHPDESWSAAVYTLAIAFNDDEEKRHALRKIGSQLFRDQVLLGAVILSSECWVTQGLPGQPHVEPRHDPNRREAVIVQGMTFLSRACGHTKAFVTRGPNNELQCGAFSSVQTDGLTLKLPAILFDSWARAGLATLRGKPTP